jgi:hypothetical protein
MWFRLPDGVNVERTALPASKEAEKPLQCRVIWRFPYAKTADSQHRLACNCALAMALDASPGQVQKIFTALAAHTQLTCRNANVCSRKLSRRTPNFVMR